MREAFAAADAPVSPKDKLRVGRDRFRIVAPLAVKRASFQENGCAYARSVIDGKPLYIEYQTLHCIRQEKTREEMKPAVGNGPR